MCNEYKYTIKKTRTSIHSQVWRIQSTIPKLFTRFSIEFPQNFITAGYGWNFLPVNINLEAPKIQNYMRNSGLLDYGTSAYSWELQNIPAMYYEPKMPPYDDVAQYLRVDLQYKNWDELALKYWKEIKDKFQTKNLEDIKKLSEKIVGGSKSEIDKIDSIFNYLQKSYRYISSDIDESGIIPHHVDEIIKNKYGDCKDLSVLGTVLLNSLGIEAFPALVKTNTKGKLRDGIITFDFNHMICYVKTKEGDEYWLDATGSSCNLGELYASLEGTTPLIIYKDGRSEFKKIPHSKSNQNLIFRNLKVYIDSLGTISGKVNMIFKGNQNLSVRSSLRSYSNADMEKVIQRYAKSNLADIKVDSMHYDDPKELADSYNINFLFKNNNNFSVSDKLLIINPSIFEMESDLSLFLDKDRQYPIHFSAPLQHNDLIEIYYNTEKFEIESFPVEIIEQFKLGSFIFKGNKITNGKIVFNRDFRINEVFIIPENYSAVTKLQEALARSENQSLVLRKL